MIPYINQEYYDALMELFKLVKSRFGLEIGLGWGTSAQAYLTSFPEGRLTAIEQEDFHKVFTPLSALFTGRLTIIKALSPEGVNELQKMGCMFDYIYIDAAHDEKSVRADITAALPMLKPGGVIAFDDYGVEGTTEEGYPHGVKPAVDGLIPTIWPVIFYKRKIKAFRKEG